MVTKLKRFSRNIVVKVIAFVFAVILLTASLLHILYLEYKDYNLESIVEKNVEKSETFDSYVREIINSIADDFENGRMNNYTGKEGYHFYISDGDEEFSNVNVKEKSYYESFRIKYLSELFEKQIQEYDMAKKISPADTLTDQTEYTFYIGFTEEYLEELQHEWVKHGKAVMPVLISMCTCAITGLVLVIYSFCVTGRKPEDNEVHLAMADSIYSDIPAGALIVIAVAWAGFASNLQGYKYYYFTNNFVMIYILFSFATLLSIALSGIIALSVARKIKAGQFLKNSLIYKAYCLVSKFFRYLFDGRMFDKYPLTKALFLRQLAFIISCAVIAFIGLLMILAEAALVVLPFTGIIILIYWYIKGNRIIYEKINQGFNESLAEQMKSERMKVELITNVSHDLKTPLTSIISYVDLLSKEEGLSETAMDYVKILQDKSERLKTIVTDLFELAKTSSGDIKLELETLDIKKLIEQTLADMEDRIERSGLIIKTVLPEKSVMVRTDGKRLYRVFQNVFDNALKYSMQGTRVYVEMKDDGDIAEIAVKNIASYEMNFTAEEVLQRFTRGDKSRTGDGSGLGLSIAESFTRVCGGNFKVDIDGDMFKVIITFKIYKTGI